MALFRRPTPNHQRGITGLTKPAPTPAARKPMPFVGIRRALPILVPLAAFLIVGTVAFVALQKLSQPQSTVAVYSTAPPAGSAALFMNALKVPHEREKEIARQAMLNDDDGPMVVKPLNEVIALTQPDRVFNEMTPAPQAPAIGVENVAQVTAQVAPAPQVAAVQPDTIVTETSAAVIEQASAGVWKPETTRVRIGRPVDNEAPCIGQLRSVARGSTIFFGSGGAELSPSDLRTIGVVGRMVEACPDAVVYITGHSDPSGSREANMILSWQRADSAVQALENAGFDVSQYEPVGFGARIPYAEGDADADLSRRVEFNIQELLWEQR